MKPDWRKEAEESLLQALHELRQGALTMLSRGLITQRMKPKSGREKQYGTQGNKMKIVIEYLRDTKRTNQAVIDSGLPNKTEDAFLREFHRQIDKAILLLERYEKKPSSEKDSLEKLLVEAEAMLSELDKRTEEANQAEACVGQEEEVVGGIRETEEAIGQPANVLLMPQACRDGGDGGLAPPERQADPGDDAGDCSGLSPLS